MIRGAGQRFLSLVLAVPVLVIGWFLAGFVGAMIPSGAATAPGDPTIEVRLIAGPLHYDFLLPPTPDTRAAFAFAEDAGLPLADPLTGWILVGWGARDFYTTSGSYGDITAGPILRAISGDTSVLRVEPWPPFDVAAAGDAVEVLHLTPDAYRRLLAGIAASTNGTLIEGTGLSDGDRFFEGEGRFNILRTCNVWVGEMLRHAGVPFGRWTPTPQAVRLSLRLHVQ